MLIRIRDTSNFQHIIDFGIGSDLVRQPSVGDMQDVYRIVLQGGLAITINQQTYDELASRLQELGIIDLDLVALKAADDAEKEVRQQQELERAKRQAVLDAADEIKAKEKQEAETERLAELGRASEAAIQSEQDAREELGESTVEGETGEGTPGEGTPVDPVGDGLPEASDGESTPPEDASPEAKQKIANEAAKSAPADPDLTDLAGTQSFDTPVTPPADTSRVTRS